MFSGGIEKDHLHEMGETAHRVVTFCLPCRKVNSTNTYKLYLHRFLEHLILLHVLLLGLLLFRWFFVILKLVLKRLLYFVKCEPYIFEKNNIHLYEPINPGFSSEGSKGRKIRSKFFTSLCNTRKKFMKADL